MWIKFNSRLKFYFTCSCSLLKPTYLKGPLVILLVDLILELIQTNPRRSWKIIKTYILFESNKLTVGMLTGRERFLNFNISLGVWIKIFNNQLLLIPWRENYCKQNMSFTMILCRKAEGVELDLLIKADNKEIVICHVTNKKLIWHGCVFISQINFW